ncbi:unnamed protein product [Clonostachys solani]|uniref:Uncharacterized protein n=1 Tax=Clonostachys solani TaxID=160281 RepID=A0A9N9W271_9HYPO|nr:unnamed protein product [Clonostachys solani]
MSSVSSGRDEPAPFLLQLFYRTGSFHTPEDFSSHTLPSHVSVYTGQDCTLHQLALELAALKPSAIPTPAIGTRLAFQLVCPDLRNSNGISHSPPRYAVKDLGNIVLGGHGPGADHDAGLFDTSLDDQKTLADARFVSHRFRPLKENRSLARGTAVQVGEVNLQLETAVLAVVDIEEDEAAGKKGPGMASRLENGGGVRGFQKVLKAG